MAAPAYRLPAMDMDFLLDNARQQAPALKFVKRLANPAVFADVDPERGLKVALFQLEA